MSLAAERRLLSRPMPSQVHLALMSQPEQDR
jgi:hypothetical protein